MNIDSKLLKSKMALKGYGIKELSEASGLHRDTISNVLNGKTSPSFKVMNSIYFALELTPDEGVDIFLSTDLRDEKEKEGAK
ncbi:helix-turn-helix domain-containing protein [Lacicoccus qingdaonensis]|uniref:Cro/C1-type HTH DNA-binding domain-containing protein n=1 Tax=Lacicoccus qingdaonensis TaxID=576118 RepID=A0A1G9EYK1_9BACL|nr:helix-turn-helix transcriptional regulator [Salinicoccus qingdaonensis]SDK81267.1 Cro/C1-type HTH DNA-binding domain-containing protein [Salinicoccus qingdaonensis]